MSEKYQTKEQSKCQQNMRHGRKTEEEVSWSWNDQESRVEEEVEDDGMLKDGSLYEGL